MNGVVHRGLSDGRVLIDARRAVAISDDVSMLMAGLARVFASIYIPEMIWLFSECAREVLFLDLAGETAMGVAGA